MDIALTRTPDLAIVDGIVGMEGDGPLNGTAKPVGVLVMGADLVAVDATCCRLMGLPPERVPTLMLAAGEAARQPAGGADPAARRADRGRGDEVRLAAGDREATLAGTGGGRFVSRVSGGRR